MVEALADGAVKAGLSRSMALTLAVKTMMGTAKILLNQQQQFHPSQLKDAVASPGQFIWKNSFCFSSKVFLQVEQRFMVSK